MQIWVMIIITISIVILLYIYIYTYIIKWIKENLYTKTYIPGQMLVILIKITDQIGILFEQNWTTASTTSMSMQKITLKVYIQG